MKKQQHYKAALYCRLSVDDGNFGGSVSIETQKILLEQYCKDHKITDYKFYCDDGLVLSISLDTFYSNKNYATRKI